MHSTGAGDSVDITANAAICFVVLASCMLILLFFFLNQIFFYVLVGVFVSFSNHKP